MAHLWLGLVDILTRRANEGIAGCEHALDLDRNLAHAHSLIGFGKLFIGRAEETEAHTAEALRLSPRDPRAFNWTGYAGISKIDLGSWEQAVAWFRRAIEANRNFPHTIFSWPPPWRTSARLNEARPAATAGLRAQPDLRNLPRPRRWRAISDHPTFWPNSSPVRRHAQSGGTGMTAAVPRGDPRRGHGLTHHNVHRGANVQSYWA